MPVTLTGTASAISGRSAPTISAPAGGDVPSASSNNQPDQGLLDLVASILAHGGLLDVAGTWSQLQTFSAGAAFGADPTFPTRTLLKPGLAGSPTLGSNWVRSGVATRDLRVWKDPIGMVHFQGQLQMTSGAPNATMFHLPSGYYPPDSGAGLQFICPVYPNAGGFGIAEVTPIFDGEVEYLRHQGTDTTFDIVVMNFSYWPSMP